MATTTNASDGRLPADADADAAIRDLYSHYADAFHPPYTIPDTATAVLGVLVTVAVLATAGRAKPGQHTENSCPIDKEATR